MRLLAFALFVSVVGCEQGKDPDDYPVLPGTGGPGNFGDRPVDAAPNDATDDAGDGGTVVNGRVCLLSDARNLTACAATGAGGYVVTLGSATATTVDNGTFTIEVPATTGLAWKVVTGTNPEDIVASVMQFGADSTIPAIPSDLWADMLTGSGATQADDTASIILAFADDQGDPLEDVQVSSTATLQPVRYDDEASPLAWQTEGSGPAGLAWLTSVDTADVIVSVVADPPPSGIDDAIGINVPVDANAITFARYAFD